VRGRRLIVGKWRTLNAPLLASALATLLCVALHALHLARWITLPGLDAWEATTEDARTRLGGTRAPADDRIVIVGLDDRTHREAPELFQTRRGLARLIDAVAAHEPRVVGLDLFFAQPELRLDPRVVAQVEDALARLAAASTASPPSPAARAAQAALAAVLEELRGDTVLADAVAGAKRLPTTTRRSAPPRSRHRRSPGPGWARLSSRSSRPGGGRRARPRSRSPCRPSRGPRPGPGS
jgi:CHASE2 domain-containing sensor protein